MKINKNLRNAGFTLVEIMIVVAIIGLLAAIAIPNFVRARQTAQANACLNNLRIIDGAENQYALENGKKTGDAAPTVAQFTVYVGHGGTAPFPACPLTGDYTIGVIGTPPACPNVATVGHTNCVLN